MKEIMDSMKVTPLKEMVCVSVHRRTSCDVDDIFIIGTPSGL